MLLRLTDANIRINEEKSEFFKDSIHYCGYRIDKYGIHKTVEKVQAIDEMPRPRSVAELRSFLGMVNYYSRFIKNLSTILALLHTLLQKGAIYKWTRNCEQAFKAAKENLKKDTVLVHYDSRLPLILAQCEPVWRRGRTFPPLSGWYRTCTTICIADIDEYSAEVCADK